MKVRDLIADSTFTPGSGRDSDKAPLVTVILPTFRRGDSGMLQRAIDSVLAQSFSDFELIVVDDASTDSTAEVLAQAMARDPRVSVIRHRQNIGLPAISEYEAYVLARGELIAFAFDDTVLYEDGLRDLVRESERHPRALITGGVNAFYHSPTDGSLLSHTLGEGVDESDLLTRNVIPNNGVLAPRAILEEVGLYDPHIALARLCDYDLWLRVRRRFPIRFLGFCIGEEHGPATTDSLGVTYPLDPWASDDRMRQRRDHLLAPSRFADLDVFDSSEFASTRARTAVATLVEKHLDNHAWMTPPTPKEATGSLVPRILVLARVIDASIQLTFEGLRDVPGIHVRIVDPASRPVSEVVDADVLIVTGQLHSDSHWTDAARAVGIPVFYFLDDHRHLDRLRADLQHLDGVFTSSEALAATARERGLHTSVTVLTPAVPGVVAEWLTDELADTELPALAVLAGEHRPPDVRHVLWPALVEAARSSDQRIRLIAPEAVIRGLSRLPGGEHVEIVPLATTADFFVTLRRLHQLGTDVLVVPSAEATDIELAGLHLLPPATVLGSRLLAPVSEANRELDGIPGVTLVVGATTSSDWTAAVSKEIATVTTEARRDRSVPSELLKARFDPFDAAETLLSALRPILSKHEPDSLVRERHMSDWLSAKLAEVEATGRPSSMLAGETEALLAQLRTAVGGKRLRLSAPLAAVPYLSYVFPIDPGGYRQIQALVWGDGDAGDEIGVEIVDPAGRILLHKVAALPRDDHPVTVTFDARQLRIVLRTPHEVRFFARTNRSAFLVESGRRGGLILGRRGGRLVLRRRARPVIHFER